MNEIIFLIEDAVEGGYTARAPGEVFSGAVGPPAWGYTARAPSESIFTEGDDMEELRSNISDAVDCHFGPESEII